MIDINPLDYGYTQEEIDAFFNQYVFVDCETTGTNPYFHNLLEVTYAVGLGEPVTLYAPNIGDNILYAAPEALAVNKYPERFPSGYPEGATDEEWDAFAAAVKGRIWVGAAPQFDTKFMDHFFHPEPLEYNHRLFDIQMYMLGRNAAIRDFAEAQGLHSRLSPANFKAPSNKDICSLASFHQPDHTSRGDVIATREAFVMLLPDSMLVAYAIQILGITLEELNSKVFAALATPKDKN